MKCPPRPPIELEAGAGKKIRHAAHLRPVLHFKSDMVQARLSLEKKLMVW